MLFYKKSLLTSWVSSNNHNTFIEVSLGLVKVNDNLAGLKPPAGAKNRKQANVREGADAVVFGTCLY